MDTDNREAVPSGEGWVWPNWQRGQDVQVASPEDAMIQHGDHS